MHSYELMYQVLIDQRRLFGENELLRRPIKKLEARLDICMILKESGTVCMFYLEPFIRGKGENCTTLTSMSQKEVRKWRAIWSYGSMLQPVTEETFLDVFVGGGGRDVGRLYLHRQI